MLENPYYHTEEAKQQRCYWRRVGLLLFGAILFAGAIALLLYPKKAGAQGAVPLISQSATDQQGNRVTIKHQPCPDTPAWLKLQDAIVFYQGNYLKACWYEYEGFYVILDESGDRFPVPKLAFSADKRT